MYFADNKKQNYTRVLIKLNNKICIIKKPQNFIIKVKLLEFNLL